VVAYRQRAVKDGGEIHALLVELKTKPAKKT